MQGIIQNGVDLRGVSIEELRRTLQELITELRYRFSTISKENFTDIDLVELLASASALASAVIPATALKDLYPNGAAKLATAIPSGQVDSTSTATAFTATVPGVTELKDGVCVMLTNGVVTSASGFTIDINGLGAKPVYSSMAAASRSTTIFNVAYTMLFVYNERRVEDGCWDVYYGYNSDTNTVAYDVRLNNSSGTMASALTRYKVMFTKRDGTLEPCTQTSNSTATNKTLTTAAFDPFQPIYYYSSTDGVAVGASPATGSTWIQRCSVDLRYSFNAGKTLTAGKPVYIRCDPQSDGTVKLDGNDCIVQDLPSATNSKVFIYLGKAYSTYQIIFSQQHPIYVYDTSLHLWTGA